MQRRFTGGAALALISLSVLTGCGGSSSSSSSSTSSAASAAASTSTTAAQAAPDFNASMAVVLADFKGVSQAMGATIQQASGQTDAALAATFKKLADRWQAAVTKLSSLNAPASVRAQVERLKPQVAKVESDLSAIVSAAQAHDAAAAKSATTKLVNDIVNAKTTATTIANKSGIK